MRNAHSGKRPQFKCHLCPKVLNSRAGIRIHTSTVHKGIRYKCAHCPGTFTARRYLVQHGISVHKEGRATPSQQCKLCGLQLNSSKSLRCHIARMHKSATTQSSKSLKQKRKPEASQTKIFCCQLCPSSFLEWKDLQCHLSQSHGISPELDAEK